MIGKGRNGLEQLRAVLGTRAVLHAVAGGHGKRWRGGVHDARDAAEHVGAILVVTPHHEVEGAVVAIGGRGAEAAHRQAETIPANAVRVQRARREPREANLVNPRCPGFGQALVDAGAAPEVHVTHHVGGGFPSHADLGLRHPHEVRRCRERRGGGHWRCVGHRAGVGDRGGCVGRPGRGIGGGDCGVDGVPSVRPLPARVGDRARVDNHCRIVGAGGRVHSSGSARTAAYKSHHGNGQRDGETNPAGPHARQ